MREQPVSLPTLAFVKLLLRQSPVCTICKYPESACGMVAHCSCYHVHPACECYLLPSVLPFHVIDGTQAPVYFHAVAVLHSLHL